MHFATDSKKTSHSLSRDARTVSDDARDATERARVAANAEEPVEPKDARELPFTD